MRGAQRRRRPVGPGHRRPDSGLRRTDDGLLTWIIQNDQRAGDSN